MLKKSLVLTLFTISSWNVYAQNPAPEDFFHLNGDLYDITFTGEKGIHIVGSNGVLLHSSDGGKRWTQTSSGTNEGLRSVDFINEKTGVIVGEKGTILRTEDAGDKWQRVTIGSTPDLVSVSVYDGLAIAVGNNGEVLRSADSGKTWSSSMIEGQLRHAVILNSSTVLIAALNGTLYRSSDAGISWTKQAVGAFTLPTEFSIAPDGSVHIAYSSSASSAIYHSDNNGNTWTSENHAMIISAVQYIDKGKAVITVNKTQPSEPAIYHITGNGNVPEPAAISPDTTSPYRPNDILTTTVNFKNSLQGFALGTKKTIYGTTDGGVSWQLISYLSSSRDFTTGSSFSSINFLNDSVGLVGTHPETIYRTENGGATWLPAQRNFPEGGVAVEAWSGRITQIQMLDDSTGFALSDRKNNGLLLTTDGWRTFTLLEDKLSAGQFFSPGITLKFTNAQEGYSLGILIQRTSDGGHIWQSKQTIFGGDSLLAIIAGHIHNDKKMLLNAAIKDKNKQYGYSVYSAIYFTENSGDTWRFIPIPKATGLGYFYFLNSDTGFVAGQQQKTGAPAESRIFRTVDGGKTWNLIDSNRTRNGKTMFTPVISGYGDTIYAGGNQGMLLKSKDRGASWEDMSLSGSSINYGSIYADSYSTYIGGNQNILLKSIPKTITTSVSEPEFATTASISDLWMKTAYPNPATGNVTVRLYYSLAIDKNTIKVNVYNSTGERVADITENFRQSTGNNPALVQWNTQGLPSGMYIIEAKGGNAQMTVPVVITR